MIRHAGLLAVALLLWATAPQAATITVHTTPSFTLEATNLYSAAFKYPSRLDALDAAYAFLNDGAADSGWGLGAFGGTSGFQAQYLFFAFDEGNGGTLGIRLASTGDHTQGLRSGSVSETAQTWGYDNWMNDQFLLISSAYTSPAPIPEPGTALLLGLGLAGLGHVSGRVERPRRAS